jgi:16S rRNA processing protein RimM
MTKKIQNAEIDPKNSGSPQTGEPVYLTIGKLRRSHGIQGEMLFEVITDFPERIKAGNHVFIGNKHKELIISSIRTMNKNLLIGFEGFEDCEAVAILRNQAVFVRKENLAPLPKGEFYQHEIIGLHVFDESGKPVGKVDEILETGANDVYVVISPSGEEILIPAIKSVIHLIDVDQHKMIVKLPEWD